VEALTDSVRLRALGLGAGVINILDCEVELILMALWIATIFAATVGQHAQQPNVMAIEQRDHLVIEKIGGRDRRLAVIGLGASDLGISIDEGLLIDASHSLQLADIERVLRTAIAG